MDIQKLVEKRLNLVTESEKFLDEHTDKETGMMSAEDAATFDKMMNDVDELARNIERFKKQSELSTKMAMPTSKPILNHPQGNIDGKVGRASDEYRKAALNALRTNFHEVNNILQESVATDGGYLVPAEWDSRLIDSLEEENVMRKLGTNITTSGEHKINVVTSKPAAVWVAEGGALTFGDAGFGQKTLDAHKLHVGVKITNELLNDNAFNLEGYIVDQFSKALGNAEEDAFITGNGIGKPTGILTTAELNSDTTLATTAGNNLAADDIINLIYKLKRPYRKNAAFLTNDATLSAIRKLKDSTLNYIWQPSLIAGEPDRLLGYPIYTSAYMPTISAGNKILAFGDFSYYNIGDRGARTFRKLGERYADTDETAFLMIERIDGILTLVESVKVLKMKA